MRCSDFLKTTTPRQRETTEHVAGLTEAIPADEQGFLAADANRSRQYTQVHASPVARLTQRAVLEHAYEGTDDRLEAQDEGHPGSA
jgi:hypothetical protein